MTERQRAALGHGESGVPGRSSLSAWFYRDAIRSRALLGDRGRVWRMTSDGANHVVPPRDPGPVPVDDCLHHRAVISERATTLVADHQHERLDPSPRLVRQHRESPRPNTIPLPGTDHEETRARAIPVRATRTTV